MALDGRVVFTYSIANFPTLRCLEQIRNDAVLSRRRRQGRRRRWRLQLRAARLFASCNRGPRHPSRPAEHDRRRSGCDWEAKEATRAIAERPGTCYSASRSIVRPWHTAARRTIHNREGACRARGIGSDAGQHRRHSPTVLRAAVRLADAGVSCRVLSMHTLKPFDGDAILAAVRNTAAS